MKLNLRSLDLNLLPVFDALMREQHLSRASDQLAMSQPAVSNALKRLRQSFNDDLFVRTSRGLKPTPRAIEIHSAIQPALQMIQHGCMEQSFDPGTSDQTLNITMNAATEYLIAPLLMAWIRNESPNTTVKLHPDHLDDIPAQLKDGMLDYAIDYVSYAHDQFRSFVLGLEDLNIVCARNHKVLKGGITLEQFETLPQVTLVPRSNITANMSHRRGTPIEQLMGKDLPNRNLAMHVSSFVAIPDIVASTDLIAIVPSRLAQQPRYKDTIQCLPVPFEYPKVEIRLLWHKSRNNDASHHWFMERVQRLVELLP
ncbi:LysR substrate-binding domain-containing protein [Parendozoicomonas sp. Alg238-R29]|uniref:LysR substrate-binding domain-containing protein n=1 Tax=Parendozoicomonas sp. Alg238-R29 TaxID=2993446 RepID=UPI00248E684D|nr:LysR substrate-binding domain-containing protein [Parendozoicomonas sp. Alg238-R29]